MKSRIEKAFTGVEYRIVEEREIVATVLIESDTFHFSRFSTFKDHGISLDNIIKSPTGDIYLIVSKVINYPELEEWIVLSAEMDEEKSMENGYETVYVVSSYQDLTCQFEIPNYQKNDFASDYILETILQQIVIANSQEKQQRILKDFNPFTAKDQGLNHNSAKKYVEHIQSASSYNYNQLCHLFGENRVIEWVQEEIVKMDLLEEIKELRQNIQN